MDIGKQVRIPAGATKKTLTRLDREECFCYDKKAI
jgi:hypothetical protein